MSQVGVLTELERFAATSAEERHALASVVAEIAGPGFRPSERLIGAQRMIALDHHVTGLRFLVVPGGRFSMGLTDRDLDCVRAVVDFDSGAIQSRIAEFEATATPVHDVNVAPFLLATTMADADPLMAATGGRFGDTAPPPEGAHELMMLLDDLRLPSESELEWAAREGGVASFVARGERLWARTHRWPDETGWGLSSMTLASWAADEWHPDYDGAPATSAPWTEGGEPGVYRGSLLYTPESEDELLFALAAVRGRRASPDDEWDVLVRFARSLPV